MVLFKFLPRRFMDAFFQSGSLRLGTMYHYRDSVNLDGARLDPAEGVRTVSRAVKEALRVTGEKYEPIINDILPFAPGASGTITGITFQRRDRLIDHYVFCTSAEFSEGMFAKWQSEDADTDACYVIHDRRAFAGAICEAYPVEIIQAVQSRVAYVRQPIDWQHVHANRPPGFIKDTDYEWQCEHRALFETRKPPMPVYPWDMVVPAARTSCAPYAVRIKGTVTYL